MELSVYSLQRTANSVDLNGREVNRDLNQSGSKAVRFVNDQVAGTSCMLFAVSCKLYTDSSINHGVPCAVDGQNDLWGVGIFLYFVP
jgi:hypothetical protein